MTTLWLSRFAPALAVVRQSRGQSPPREGTALGRGCLHGAEAGSVFFLFNKCSVFFFFSFIFISWRLITLQYFSGFCHTLT